MSTQPKTKAQEVDADGNNSSEGQIEVIGSQDAAIANSLEQFETDSNYKQE